ncbi:YaaC family protein [Sinomonas sp. ASV322]|uniref:YaaC family protein n=1 Tax=Sinomonas sp. ASV322 TaxID=3041920 RepID=UPI0035A2F3EF
MRGERPLTLLSSKRSSYLPRRRPARPRNPKLDDTDSPTQPFMLWWAVLYPLSRLARYYPNVWAKLTSISTDPHAAPIEFILREAVRAVPELALRAIRRFA